MEINMIAFTELLKRAKTEKVVVHTPTEEQAKGLLKALDEKGYTWYGGKKLTAITLYKKYSEKTCYCFGIDVDGDLLNKQVVYGSLEFHQENNYTVIKFKDIDFSEKPKLKTLEQVVFETLTEHPETQKDDFILILKVYEKLTDKDTMYHSFSVFMTYHNDFGLPPFESIRRCRQKVQAKHPELVDPSTAKHRHKLIEEYKDYAKDKEVVRTHKVGDKAKVIGNDSDGVHHFFEIGSIVTYDGFSNFGHPEFAGEKLSQALALGDFEWIGE